MTGVAAKDKLAASAASDSTPTAGASLEARFRETRFGWAVLAVVWLVSAVYLWVNLRNGLIPSDAGMLAEMADRVLHGQVPYRDFIENYTGGLTYFNALAFRLFGENFFSLRIPLFLFFLGWVPSVYFIARRFAGPVAAAGATLLSVAWSVPNYPEAMPSWYNLFFATWGVLALIRFIESEKKRWLWIAGLCAGLSFLVKISGLYFIAAALLFFVFYELNLSRTAPEAKRPALGYKFLASAALLLFASVVVGLILKRPTFGEAFYFILPNVSLVALLLRNLWRTPSGGNWLRLRRLFSTALPFLGAAFAPVAIFLAYYAKAGALGDWYSGVLRSNLHILWAAWNSPSLLFSVGLIPILLILWLAYSRECNRARWVPVFAFCSLAALLILAWRFSAVYWALGLPLPVLIPLLALALPLFLRRSAQIPQSNRLALFLLVATAIECGLDQFPFSIPIYFCYIAPLVILAVLALLSAFGKPNRVTVFALILFYFSYAVWLHSPAFFTTINLPADRPYTLAHVKLPGFGGIRGLPKQASEYEQLIPAVLAHAHGPFVYCTPDCPSVYFLSRKRNPTRTIYDFLDPDYFDPLGRTNRILQTLTVYHVHAAVLAPIEQANSGVVAPCLRAALDARFPNSATVGKFEVRWRTPGHKHRGSIIRAREISVHSAGTGVRSPGERARSGRPPAAGCQQPQGGAPGILEGHATNCR